MPSDARTVPRVPFLPPSEHALAVARRLRIGELGSVDGVAIRRTSLLTYRVAGFMLDLGEVAAEVAYLAAERVSIREEPTLRRASELAGRRHRGTFKVRLERIVSGRRVYEATWTADDWRATPQEDRAVLDELVDRAHDLGLRAKHVGYKVLACLPRARRAA